MAKRLRALVVDEVSLVPKGANNKRIFLTKAAPEENDMAGQAEIEQAPEAEIPAPEGVEKGAVLDVPADVRAQLEDLRKAADAQKAELETLRKAADEAVAKQVELQKALASEVESKEVREAITKHAETFKHLPGKAADVAPALRALKKAAPAQAELIEGLLKQVDALLGQGSTLEPVGKATDEAEPPSRARELSEKVEALMKADTKITREKAIVAVLDAHPHLYTDPSKKD